MRSLVCICPNMHNDRWPYSNYPQLIGTATDQVPTTKPILLPPTLGKIHSVHRLSTRDLRVERDPRFGHLKEPSLQILPFSIQFPSSTPMACSAASTALLSSSTSPNPPRPSISPKSFLSSQTLSTPSSFNTLRKSSPSFSSLSHVPCSFSSRSSFPNRRSFVVRAVSSKPPHFPCFRCFSMPASVFPIFDILAVKNCKFFFCLLVRYY